MTIGFPAHAEEVRTFSCPTDMLVAAIERTLQLLKWRYRRSKIYLFEARTPFNFWRTYGDNVIIGLKDQATVLVHSECSVPTNCFDFGNNRRNVNRFFKQLEQLVEFRVMEFFARNIPIR